MKELGVKSLGRGADAGWLAIVEWLGNHSAATGGRNPFLMPINIDGNMRESISECRRPSLPASLVQDGHRPFSRCLINVLFHQAKSMAARKRNIE